MSAAPPIPLEELRSVLRYNPETGKFYWRRRTQARVPRGSVAGHKHKGSGGYIVICYRECRMRAHMLAWYFMTGEWPDRKIDHRDRDKTNNRWANLRKVTDQQNAWNQGLRKNNTSGLIGVSWSRVRQKWVSYLHVEGRRKTLGWFDEKDTALAARNAAVVEHYGEFAWVQ